jgi:hypothetical protein
MWTRILRVIHGRVGHPSGIGTPAEMLGRGPRAAPPGTPHARATLSKGRPELWSFGLPSP